MVSDSVFRGDKNFRTSTYCATDSIDFHDVKEKQSLPASNFA
jgi:hypothetical protein